MDAGKPIKLLSALNRFVLIGLIGVLGIVIIEQVYSQYKDFSVLAEQLRNNHLKRQKDKIRREVHRVVERIRFHQSVSQNLAKKLTRERLDQAVTLIELLTKTYAHLDSPKESQQRILAALAAIRFDTDSGYFFVFNTRGEVIMHPVQPDLVGKSMLDLRDSNGHFFIRDLIELAKREEQGSLVYNYYKPGNQTEQFAKISYIRLFPELDWIIGTGLYLDDLERKEKSRLLAEIQQMRYDKNGYLFVDDWQGVVLAHGAQADLIGKNIWEYQDSNGKKVVQKLIQAAQTPNGDYVSYRWRKPDTGEERAKISFSMGIPEWQWMIGTGAYTDDIEVEIATLQETVQQQIMVSLVRTLAIGGLAGLFLFYWIRRIYSALHVDFQHFGDFFKSAATHSSLMDQAHLRFHEFQQHAGHVNHMLQDKLDAEKHLREHKQQLEQLVEERTRRLSDKTRELEHLAMTDALTGILNRRYFEEQSQERLKEISRYGIQSSLVLFDIDHFKAINDQHGHAISDLVLKTLAEKIRPNLRSMDLFGRWGGEEFTLFLHHTDCANALDLCRRLMKKISSEPCGPVDKVTASFGITGVNPGDSLDRLVHRADEAMYQAKKAGRNRIVSC